MIILSSHKVVEHELIIVIEFHFLPLTFIFMTHIDPFGDNPTQIPYIRDFEHNFIPFLHFTHSDVRTVWRGKICSAAVMDNHFHPSLLNLLNFLVIFYISLNLDHHLTPFPTYMHKDYPKFFKWVI
jgi:hypothetical protein